MTADASGAFENGAWRNMSAKTIPGTLSFPAWCVERFAGRRRILEIGCGPHGGLATLAAQMNAEFCGVDINPQAVADSCLLWPDFCFVAHDASQAFPLCIGQFDVIAMKAFMTCLPTRAEHLAVLSNARRVAADGCILAIMDFLQNWDVPLYKARYEGGLAQGLERGTFSAPSNALTSGYKAHHFTSDELDGLMRESGWKIERFEPLPVVTRSGNRINGFALLAKA